MTVHAPSAPEALVERYSTRGPRYTSYPTAPQFVPLDAATTDVVTGRWGEARADLSLYLHIPYCKVRCSFCGCHTVITQKTERGEPYVDALLDEMDAVATVTDLRRPVRQLALGGGTPNFLPFPEMERLVRGLEARAPFAADAERSIECDPRTVTPDYLRGLRALGFNRFSFGLQDVDPDVMAAVNRPQTLATVQDVLAAVRHDGDVPLNLDLIYGLPRQSDASWAHTIASVIALRPTRLAVYGYAHVPWMKPHQKAMERHGMPDDALRARLQEHARNALLAAGYVEIGFDHYALPDDELAVAWRARTLHRNFMGYTTRRGLDLVALGTSGISDVNGTYVQNDKDVPTWTEKAHRGEPTWERGVVLSSEDRLRREVILDLSCNLEVDLGRYVDDALVHFAAEIAALAPMEDDGLLLREDARLALTPVGRRFVRHACMAFDQYLPPDTGRFSVTS